MGRTQHLLHMFARLRDAKAHSFVPIYLDSPMAINATQLLRALSGPLLERRRVRAAGSVAHCTPSPEESRALDGDGSPKIIVSASGMATGGRVLHHLRRFLPDQRNTILLVGYQASGTRGRSLMEGTDELKIHGQYVTVRAQIRARGRTLGARRLRGDD